ncbi:CHASE domain-containing protein, partial [Arthrospira platensis SPKY1]|nr:CHASE domain-containing protein [Arthrospira platensis SPKY1]
TAAAVHRSIDTSSPAVSEPFRLVQETGQQRAVVLYHSVFREGELRGVVSATLRMRDMLDAALGDVQSRGLVVCLADPQTEPGNHTLVGEPGCGDRLIGQTLPRWTLEKPVE